MMTNLEWIKTEATAEEIVDFLTAVCTTDAMAQWCDCFSSCRECKVAWLLSRRNESVK